MRLNHIYSILQDEEKRAYYDKFGEEALEDFDGGEGEEAEVGDEEVGSEINVETAPELLEKLGKTGLSKDRSFLFPLQIINNHKFVNINNKIDHQSLRSY